MSQPKNMDSNPYASPQPDKPSAQRTVAHWISDKVFVGLWAYAGLNMFLQPMAAAGQLGRMTLGFPLCLLVISSLLTLLLLTSACIGSSVRRAVCMSAVFALLTAVNIHWLASFLNAAT